MKQSSIEWCHRSWNPLPGECLNAVAGAPCKAYCYMERFYRQNPEMRHPIRLDEKRMAWSPASAQIIFAFSRIDFLHPDMRRDWQERAIRQMARNQHATYVILTKFPAEYTKHSWPHNCWLGTTVDGLSHTMDNLYDLMRSVSPDYTRFVSYEPLLKEPSELWTLPVPPFRSALVYVPEQFGTLSWAIIGADSNAGADKPPQRWADTLVSAFQQQKIPVLVKDNYNYEKRVKEMPGGWVITDDGLIQTQKIQPELF